MINRPKSSMLVVALALACAVPAGAADSSRKQAGSATAPASATAERIHEVRMSKLIGMNVHDPRGSKLGEVKDVVVDMSSGRVHYAVLSFGGFLGVGDKLFAIPLSQARPDGKGRLVLDATKDELKSAPAFDAKRWPNWTTDPYRAEVDLRYGAAPADAKARLRRASDVLKAEVRDANRADIGDIEDMVVDFGSGRIHYVVVEFNRAWNPNDKLVALPMTALRDAASAPPAQRNDDAAAPPRNPPKALSLEAPSGPTKGPASATIGPGGVQTRPPAIDASGGVQKLERQPKDTMTSYADDEDLVFSGTREQLRDAPAFDRKRYPDLTDATRRQAFDRRLSNW